MTLVMRRLAPLALLAVASQASAVNNATLTITLSSANGGAGTHFAWEFGGAWLSGGFAYTTNPNIVGVSSVGESLTTETTSGYINFIPVGNLPPASFTGNFMNTYDGLNLGLVAKNVETNATRDVSTINIWGYNQNGVQGLLLQFAIPGNLPLTYGQHMVLTGTTSGSIDLAQDFTLFNAGLWTSTANGLSQTLIINSGAPAVPEPSTYGLVIGGLALAVVAVRRRKASR